MVLGIPATIIRAPAIDGRAHPSGIC